jgi:hypothetical protein
MRPSWGLSQTEMNIRLYYQPAYVSEFDAVKGTIDSSYRLIVIEFQRLKDGSMKLDFTVPMSTTASVLEPKELKSLVGRARE